MAIQYETEVPTYADILSAANGETAGAISPTYGAGSMGADTGGRSADLMRRLSSIQYERESLGQQKGFSDIQSNRATSRARASIPQQYNRRGLIDSGLYQQAMRRSYEDQLIQQAITESAMAARLGSLGQQQLLAEGQYAQGGGSAALADAQRRIMANLIRDNT
jgi:hypothetical protein